MAEEEGHHAPSLLAPTSPLGPGDHKEESDGGLSTITEGLCQVQLKPEFKTFYNPAQEINRDISILGIQTYINITPTGKHKKPEQVSVLEAMAASGIRSIRYAKEIDGIVKILANDLSEASVGVIRQNSLMNGTEYLVEPTCSEACALMRSQPNSHFVVDIDPYGTPVPFLDAAISVNQLSADNQILLPVARLE